MKYLKFKILANGYPSFRFSGNLLEEVELHEFYKAETVRLPLFIGSQSGIHPEHISLKDFEGQLFAVLSTSLLSGHQADISICRIENGEAIVLHKIALTGKFTPDKLIERKKEEPQDGIHIFLPEIQNYLTRLGFGYRGNSLSTIYDLVIRKAYRKYLSYAQRNIYKDWISFLSTEEASSYLELYRLLDKSTRVHYISEKDQIPALRQQLAYFGKIRNPYRPRSKKACEHPGQEVLEELSDFGLCLHYNNHININSLEAWKLQGQILKECSGRGLYLQEEAVLRHHANPIEIRTASGTAVVAVPKEIELRVEKDIVVFETGPAIPHLTYERQYGLMNLLTDTQLIERLNDQMDLRYWGGGRAAVVRALQNQLIKRRLDTSEISTETSFSLKYCVVLKNNKLIRVGDLKEEQLHPIVRGYLKKCYPDQEYGEIEIDEYDIDHLRIFSPVTNKVYIISTNDLIKRKAEMQTVTQWL